MKREINWKNRLKALAYGLSSIKSLSFKQAYYKCSNWKRYLDEFDKYKQMCQDSVEFSSYPCLGDWSNETPVEPTYFYQDSWAFERIVLNSPDTHYDIGSNHKLVSLLSKVVNTTMIDIRPLPVSLNSLKFIEGSILDLPFKDNSLESISSICVVEHIGLGRYTDPLDPCGTIKALNELKRVLKPSGYLYLSVPINDKDKTYFNAHRAFTEETILDMASPLRVKDKAYIYGYEFLQERQSGFGTICLELQKT